MNNSFQEEKNLEEINTGVLSNQVSQPQEQPGSVAVPSGGLLFVPLSFVILAFVLVFLARLEFRKARGNTSTSKQACQQAPCMNCRFFQNNPYLKCAVHPSKALTSEAIDCPDYWSGKSDKFSS